MDRRLHVGLVALLVVFALAVPALATNAAHAPIDTDGATSRTNATAPPTPSSLSISTLDPVDSVTAVDAGTAAASTSPPGKVAFERDSFREERGDRIFVPITFETGSIVDLQIYGPGFDAELKVRDRNDDGRVVVVINSYRGGDPAEGYVPLDPGDAIGISQLFREVDTLPVGEYDLRLSTDTSRDSGTLYLEERRTDGVSLLRAPGSADDDFDSVDAVRDGIESGRVSALDRRDGAPVFADDDVLIVELEGTGFGGAVTKPRDRDVSLLFRRVTGCEATDELLTGLESEVVVDSDRNEYYAVIDTEDLTVERVPGVTGSCDTALHPGDRATIDLVFPEGSALAATDDENVTAGTVTIVERSATLDDITLDPAANQTVAGSTTLAPGTELAVRLTGDGVDRTRTATVSETGRFTTTFDLSDVDRFATLDIAVSEAGTPLTDESPSTVVGADTPEVRVSDQTVGASDAAVAIDLASLPEGGFVALQRSGTVLGVSGYHEGVVRDLSIPVEEPPSGSATVSAVVYRDVNGNGEFDDADRPYTAAGESVATSATVGFPQVTTTVATTTTTTTPVERGGAASGNDLVGLLVAALLVGGPIVLALREG